MNPAPSRLPGLHVCLPHPLTQLPDLRPKARIRPCQSEIYSPVVTPSRGSRGHHGQAQPVPALPRAGAHVFAAWPGPQVHHLGPAQQASLHPGPSSQKGGATPPSCPCLGSGRSLLHCFIFTLLAPKQQHSHTLGVPYLNKPAIKIEKAIDPTAASSCWPGLSTPPSRGSRKNC